MDLVLRALALLLLLQAISSPVDDLAKAAALYYLVQYCEIVSSVYCRYKSKKMRVDRLNSLRAGLLYKYGNLNRSFCAGTTTKSPIRKVLYAPVHFCWWLIPCPC